MFVHWRKLWLKHIASGRGDLRIASVEQEHGSWMSVYSEDVYDSLCKIIDTYL